MQVANLFVLGKVLGAKLLITCSLFAMLSRFEQRFFDSLSGCVELFADVGLEPPLLEQLVHDFDCQLVALIMLLDEVLLLLLDLLALIGHLDILMSFS